MSWRRLQLCERDDIPLLATQIRAMLAMYLKVTVNASKHGSDLTGCKVTGN